MLGQTGEYLFLSGQTLDLKPVLATSWTPNSKADVWTFKIRQGVKFHNGAPLTADDVVYTYQLHTNPKGSSAALSAFASVLLPAGVVKVDDFTVAFHLEAPNGNFPYLTSSDNYNMIILPKGYDPAKWESTFIGTGPFKLGSYTPKSGATFTRNEIVLGHQGAALADPVHVLRDPAAVGGGADRRDDRRPRAVLGLRRRGAAHRQLQHHQAEVERAPPAVDAQRPGPVHRPAGPAGDRAQPQPAADRAGAVQGQRRRRQRQPVRARVPVHQHQHPAAHAGHRQGQVAARRRPGTARGSAPSWPPRTSRRSPTTPRSWPSPPRPSA